MPDLRDLFVTYEAVKPKANSATGSARNFPGIGGAFSNLGLDYGNKSIVDYDNEEDDNDEVTHTESTKKPFIVPREEVLSNSESSMNAANSETTNSETTNSETTNSETTNEQTESKIQDQANETEKNKMYSFETGENGTLDKAIEQLFNDEGIDIRITSYKRNTSSGIGNAGGHSHHSTGMAVDISLPKDSNGNLMGNIGELKQKILNNPRIIQFLSDNDFGIIDESSEEAQKKTGATGAHLHIGPDKLGKDELELDKLYNKIRDADLSNIDLTKQSDSWTDDDKSAWAKAMFNAYVKAMKKNPEYDQVKSDATIYRLAYYMTLQSAVESGWGASEKARANNNYGGHLKNAQVGQLIHYSSLDDFANAQLRTLKKWNVKDAESLKDYIHRLYTNNEDGLRYCGSEDEQTYHNKINGCSKRLTGYVGFTFKYGGKIVLTEKYSRLRRINDLNIWKR